MGAAYRWLEHLAPVRPPERLAPRMLTYPRIIRYWNNHNVVTVDNWEDVRRFFEIMQFVPYDKGSSWVCACGGDEKVRVYSADVMVGEFTIHHGTNLRWEPVGTHIHLTPEAIQDLEAYLNQEVYAMKVPVNVLEKHAPIPGLSPVAEPARTENRAPKTD